MGQGSRIARIMNFQEWLVDAGQAFPRMNSSNCRPTSPADARYNCIAWAADDVGRWWWPDLMGQKFWPEEVPRVQTLDAFVQAYSMRGYRDQSAAPLETGLAKVAIFTDERGAPTHAARQLPDGRWTSKLGIDIDIEHELTALEGPVYGVVSVILAKRVR